MERYTQRKADGRVSVPPEQLDQALERLARFEDMALGLEREQGDITARLASLREQGRDKTVQFRELLAQKLTNSNLRLLLERYRLL